MTDARRKKAKATGKPERSAVAVRAGAPSGGETHASHVFLAVGPRWLDHAETAAAAVLLLVATALHFRVWFHAGPLWRDEVNSVNLVLLPFSEIWRNLQYDSFPLLWFMLLKVWMAVFGTSDFAIRGMGFVIGLGTLAAIWRTARLMGNRVPLTALAIFGLAPTAFLVGDSIRAYGLASLLLILLTGSMWRLVRQRTTWRSVETGLLALLSVQCLYQNSVMLLAIGSAAAAIALVRRDWRLLFTLALIGAVAAVSILPYLPTMAQIGRWNIIIKGDYSLAWLGAKFIEALGPGATWMAIVWLVWAVLAIGLCLVQVWRRDGNERSRAIFVVWVAMVSLAAYAVFLRRLGYPTQAWYYLPIMALLAAVFESARVFFDARRAAVRIGVLVATLGVAAAGTAAAWTAAATRQSSVDLVTAKLEALASPDDFIVLNPHFYGVSFARYYHGKTPWTSVPDLGDHYLHAYDRLMAKMDAAEAIEPILAKVAATLRSGHRVWLVGSLDFVPPDKAPLQVPPLSKIPNGPKGMEGTYEFAWSQQVAWVIQHSARDFDVVPVALPGPVNPFEWPLLVAFPKLQSTGQ